MVFIDPPKIIHVTQFIRVGKDIFGKVINSSDWPSNEKRLYDYSTFQWRRVSAIFFIIVPFKNMQEVWNFMLPVKIIRAYFSFYTDGTE